MVYSWWIHDVGELHGGFHASDSLFLPPGTPFSSWFGEISRLVVVREIGGGDVVLVAGIDGQWLGKGSSRRQRRLELAEDAADDDDDEAKSAMSRLRNNVLEEVKLHDSFLQEYLGHDSVKESPMDSATSKCTQFLLETASGEIEGQKLATPFEKTKIYTLGTMLPCMRRYAFLGSDFQDHDPVQACLIIFPDFDLTCTLFDSSANLAELTIQIAPKSDQTQPESEVARMSSDEPKNTWQLISEQYTKEYSQCINSILSLTSRKVAFDYETLHKALEQVPDFEKKASSRVIESGSLKGLNLQHIKLTGQGPFF
ncbi:hypothetical protein PTKIN_Ptkin06aG0173200 [Pterospermum kingtungense]